MTPRGFEGSHAVKFGYEIPAVLGWDSANFARFSSFAFDGVTAGALQPNGANRCRTPALPFAGFSDGLRPAGLHSTRNSTSWAAAIDDSTAFYHSGRLEDSSPRLTAKPGSAVLELKSPFQTKYGPGGAIFDPERPRRSDRLGGGAFNPTPRTVLFPRATTTTSIRGIGLAWHPCDKWVVARAAGWAYCTRWISSSRKCARPRFDEYVANCQTQQAPTGDPTADLQNQPRAGSGDVRDAARMARRRSWGPNLRGRVRGGGGWDPKLHNPYVVEFQREPHSMNSAKKLPARMSYQGFLGCCRAGGAVAVTTRSSRSINLGGHPAPQTAVFAAGAELRPVSRSSATIRLRS